MGIFKFKGGVHPLENKEYTENKQIEKMPVPNKVYIPLLQHIGTPLESLVNVGDEVKIGQKIGDSKAFLSSPVHASVSGKVVKIEVLPFPVSGKIKTIVIENDEKYECVKDLKSVMNYKKLSKNELLEIIREKGIVGQGGATFPTHIKLNPPADKKIDTLILNGAECEPYLNADNRMMIEHSTDIIEGIKIILHILGINKAIIGIEDNKKEAIEIMKKACEKEEYINIKELKTKYPQGGEKQLIKAILDREVPSKALPSEIGVVVQNTSTAKAIYDAVIKGMPLVERVLTVSGKGIKEPKNLLVRIGTRFKDVLDYCGVDRNTTKKLVSGGPMMGISQHTEEVPVIKGSSGILALTDEEIKPYKAKSCISCGKCIDACPMNLMPLMYAKLARFEEWEDMDEYSLMDCIECGSCAYACPANRPLTEAIKMGKSKLRMMKK